MNNTANSFTDAAGEGVQAGATIRISQLQRKYGNVFALSDVSLELPAGKVLALLGPSGCGKSTLLKLIAGLDQPTAGTIHLNGQLAASSGTMVPAQKRNLGMVFQDYALWPHMSVFGNVAFPLQMKGVDRASVKRRVDEVLEAVGLAHLAQRAPSALSGGQQQRVALARAIVGRPSLLLFDEPLSNLDRDLRESLALEIARLLRELGTTAIYVTHDHEEACTVADEVAVMFHGQVEQMASPMQLWGAPASERLAQFLKIGTLLPASRSRDGVQLQGTAQWLAMAWPESETSNAARQEHEPGMVLIPHSAIHLHAAGDAVLTAQIKAQQYRNGGYIATLELPAGQQIQAFSKAALPMNAAIGVGVDVQQLQWFAASGA